jgi:hypothetical protein
MHLQMILKPLLAQKEVFIYQNWCLFFSSLIQYVEKLNCNPKESHIICIPHGKQTKTALEVKTKEWCKKRYILLLFLVMPWNLTSKQCKATVVQRTYRGLKHKYKWRMSDIRQSGELIVCK